MSILIKGMEMPKDCPMCPLSHWNASGNFTGCDVVGGKRYAMADPKYANSNVRPDWCPLIPVPPHGDLIDRDALSKSLDKLCDRVCQYSKAQRKVMCGACPLGDAFAVVEDDAPTIIEAEEVAGDG